MNPSPQYEPHQLTSDTLFNGKVILYQPTRGYRFSVDAPLLIWFACTAKTARTAADLGSGCGVLGVSLLLAEIAKRVVAVEIQPRLAWLSAYNARANGIADEMFVITANLQDESASLPTAHFELVVSNPPFWPATEGRLPPDSERRIARHEVSMDLVGLTQTARRILHPRKGRFCIAYPAKRITDLLAALSTAGLNTTRMCFVHPGPAVSAELVLLEARCCRRGHLIVDPPLFLKNVDGTDSLLSTTIRNGSFCTAFDVRQDFRPLPIPNGLS